MKHSTETGRQVMLQKYQAWSMADSSSSGFPFKIYTQQQRNLHVDPFRLIDFLPRADACFLTLSASKQNDKPVTGAVSMATNPQDVFLPLQGLQGAFIWPNRPFSWLFRAISCNTRFSCSSPCSRQTPNTYTTRPGSGRPRIKQQAGGGLYTAPFRTPTSYKEYNTLGMIYVKISFIPITGRFIGIPHA